MMHRLWRSLFRLSSWISVIGGLITVPTAVGLHVLGLSWWLIAPAMLIWAWLVPFIALGIEEWWHFRKFWRSH